MSQDPAPSSQPLQSSRFLSAAARSFQSLRGTRNDLNCVVLS